ncbi:hypothetical protein M9Y10_039703 [Tritrichomonas musculus]|uniref:Ankyrin repeat protein n=1 Tax=Tritrichomonas musculus TaxID=1915356 RepID=A0ABR2GSZ9_9EUKA
MPFISAILSGSEEIIKLFIDIKVDINYTKVFKHFNEIAKINPKIILLMINETKTDFKNQIIRESFKTALSLNNVEIPKFLLNEKYEFEDLLIRAAELSNLEIIEIILEFNHSVEFINKIGKLGTEERE